MSRRKEQPHEKLARKEQEACDLSHDPWLQASLFLRLIIRKERDGMYRGQLNKDCDNFIDSVMDGVKMMVRDYLEAGPHGSLASLDSRACKICGEVRDRHGSCPDKECKGHIKEVNDDS